MSNKTDPTLLVVETCYEASKVLLIQGEQYWFKESVQERKQAQTILQLIDGLLGETRIERESLTSVAYFNGPGSFTGIRIGAAVVEALSIALNLPVYGICSLKMLAYQAHRQGLGNRITTVINAHMQEVYQASFEFVEGELQVLEKPENIAYQGFLDKLKGEHAIVGNGLLLPELNSLRGDANLKVEPETLALHVQEAFSEGLFSDFSDHQPVYLRNSIAWKKLSEQPKLLRD